MKDILYDDFYSIEFDSNNITIDDDLNSIIKKRIKIDGKVIKFSQFIKINCGKIRTLMSINGVNPHHDDDVLIFQLVDFLKKNQNLHIWTIIFKNVKEYRPQGKRKTPFARLLAQKEITQYELSIRTKINRQTINAWSKGQNDIMLTSIANMLVICDALDIEHDEFIKLIGGKKYVKGN